MYTEHAPLSRTCSAKSFTLSTRDVMFVKMWFAGQRSDVLMLKSHQTAADTGGTKGRSGQRWRCLRSLLASAMELDTMLGQGEERRLMMARSYDSILYLQEQLIEKQVAPNPNT